MHSTHCGLPKPLHLFKIRTCYTSLKIAYTRLQQLESVYCDSESSFDKPKDEPSPTSKQDKHKNKMFKERNLPEQLNPFPVYP